jgi:hypothetical protein
METELLDQMRRTVEQLRVLHEQKLPESELRSLRNSLLLLLDGALLALSNNLRNQSITGCRRGNLGIPN